MSESGAPEPDSAGSALPDVSDGAHLSDMSHSVDHVTASKAAADNPDPHWPAREVPAAETRAAAVVAAELELAKVADTDVELQPERFRAVHTHLQAALAETDTQASGSPSP